jgi:hypothetical protein
MGRSLLFHASLLHAMSESGPDPDIAFRSFCMVTSGIWVDPSGPEGDNRTRHLET